MPALFSRIGFDEKTSSTQAKDSIRTTRQKDTKEP